MNGDQSVIAGELLKKFQAVQTLILRNGLLDRWIELWIVANSEDKIAQIKSEMEMTIDTLGTYYDNKRTTILPYIPEFEWLFSQLRENVAVQQDTLKDIGDEDY